MEKLTGNAVHTGSDRLDFLLFQFFPPTHSTRVGKESAATSVGIHVSYLSTYGITLPSEYWGIYLVSKIRTRLFSRSSHGSERGGMEGTGGFKFHFRPNSFFWFEVNGAPEQDRALSLHVWLRQKLLFFDITAVEIIIHEPGRFSLHYFEFLVFPGERRWRTESDSPSRDWPLEVVLKMEAVIEKECSALGGLFQTLIGDMKVSEAKWTLQRLLTFCYQGAIKRRQ